ncbi:MAG: hypothetical protein ACI4D3_13380 [Lachnospiraceae bacterium]
MQDYGRLERERRIWRRLMTAGVVAGSLSGLAGSFLPEWVLYETSMYYAEGRSQGQGLLFSDFFTDTYDFRYFVYYLCIRILIPFVFLLAGILKKGFVLLRIQAAAELIALTFQSVLIFGAGGMEMMFMNLCIYLIPESCILLTIILALCEKKTGFSSVKQYILTGIRAALLLCCGAVVEFYLFRSFM